MGHFTTQPGGPAERLTLRGQLDFRDDEPRVVTEELVYLPPETVMHGHMAMLLDDRTVAESQHLLRIRNRNLVLEFRARDALRNALDGQKRLIPGDTHPDR